MLIRFFTAILVVASCFVLLTGQTLNAKKAGAEKTDGAPGEKLLTMPFPNGVNLKFLIQELAGEMDLIVAFDAESRFESRTVRIVLKNVTVAEALEQIFLQERLHAEESGPKTILVTSRIRESSIARLGVGITPLTEQRAKDFGVQAGILVNNVRTYSPASIAGLKAGDVIVQIEGHPVRTAIGVINEIVNKKDGDLILKVVRDRKDQTVTIPLSNTSKTDRD